jgi:dipeptidyl aminopeptidase/acylaminoacyl peptidase
MNFNNGGTRLIHPSDTLILVGFSLQKKENGFFRLILNGRSNLEKLVMEPRMYYYEFSPREDPGSFYPFFPIKAKFASKYIVERMSATEYPNLYVSDSLVKFCPITELAPQKEYNWYTTELYHWFLPGGKRGEGILYKPQDFDPSRKYPIIFFYYDKLSDALNNFINPALSDGIMNIPWFVSHDYLVFEPNIYFTEGYPGQSAFNSVVSAAQSLTKLPFIDSKHMGLQGHSFGGYETNYIVSHTNLFAAAASSAGFAEIISMYGLAEDYFEHGQGRMGVSMWERPDLYIKNSPLFNADKVTTPLLIMHSKQDESVPYYEGRGWFNGLAGLGKRVWMLTYFGEGHLIDNKDNRLDFSIRLSQFFDHFLKGAPPPKWMTD